MPGQSISPNMSLILPGVGVTLGPQWASDLNSSLGVIDGHNHSPGSGVQITPDGLDINTDLPINNNNIVDIKSLRLTVQAAALSDPEDLTCLYSVGVDLYFNDGNGNQIQITDNGGVAGTPGSIANLTSPASASYVSASSKFVWQSNTNTAADMDMGAAIMRNITASSFGLTLTPPVLTSNYTITLPALPVSQKIMTLDASGNMAAPYSVDNVTIEVATNVIQLKDSGISKAKMGPTGADLRLGSQSSSFTASVNVQAYDVSTASSDVTVTLPSPPTLPGHEFTFTKTSQSNNLTISGAINGASEVILTALNQSITIYSDGSVYKIKSTGFRPLVVRASRTGSSPSFPHDTQTQLVYDSAQINTNSSYNVTTGIFTVLSGGAGAYALQASAIITGTSFDAGEFVNLSYQINSGDFVVLGRDINELNGNGAQRYVSGSDVVYLAESDTVKFYIYQHSGR